MQTFNIFGPPKAYLWECLGPLSSNFQERTKVIDITWDVLLSLHSPTPTLASTDKSSQRISTPTLLGMGLPFQIS